MILATPETPNADWLRARLGKGARQDAPDAPADALRTARHGMAFFARQLNTLSDEALAQPSRIAGWQRAHVVAHVSIEARKQALAIAALRGLPPEDDFDLSEDVDFAASLPPRALRHLFEHAHVHANVEWRDLSSAGWDRTVDLPPSETLAARELPMHQAGRLWWGACALNSGVNEGDMPRGLGLPPGPLHTMRTKLPGASAPQHDPTTR